MRRVVGLGRTEFLLFWRNRMAVFTALGLPAATLFALNSLDLRLGGGLAQTAFMLTATAGFVLLYVVYYNLTAAYVARREHLVLKRLRTGETTDWQILLATGLPALVIALAQLALLVGGGVLLGLPAPVNGLVLAVGLVAGVVLFGLLAALSTVFTRSVEMAQLSTMPLLVLCLVGSGLVVPLEILPDALSAALRSVPMTPVVELVRLGWLGTTGGAAATGFSGALAAAAVPAGWLAGWLVVAFVGVRQWFRWETRR
jgi:ABC-2 type transport system permease protein